MSVYDTFDRIEIIASIAFIAFVVCLVVVVLTCTFNDKYDSVSDDKYGIAVIVFSVCTLVSAFIMIANELYVREIQYSNAEYNVSQMAIDYDARVIESDNADCPYISRFEGYGAEEWIYFVRKPDAQDVYLRESDC